jgi:hypothetical protein
LGVCHFFFSGRYVYDRPLEVRRWTLVVWIAAAFSAVLFLRRVEKARTPVRTLVLMAMVLALAALFPEGIRDWQVAGATLSAWLWLLLLLLVVAGSSGSLVTYGEEERQPLVGRLLRGPAIAVSAPLVLFASRPMGRGRSPSIAGAVSRAVFAVLPYAVPAGFFLVLGVDRFIGGIAEEACMFWLGFVVWAWFGCAILFLLSPWPAYPRVFDGAEGMTLRKTRWVGTGVFAAMALIVLFRINRHIIQQWFRSMIELAQYLLWLFLKTGSPGQNVGWGMQLRTIYYSRGVLLVAPWVMLFVLLSPWPAYFRVPKLGELPRGRKMGPFSTALFMAMPLALVASFGARAIWQIVSGELFAGGFTYDGSGYRLDLEFLFFSGLVLLVFPYVAAVRWMSDRNTRAGYWVFAAPTALMCVCVLSFLILPFYKLLKYTHAMGFSLMRVLAVVYGLGGYTLIILFLSWALRRPGGERGGG